MVRMAVVGLVTPLLVLAALAAVIAYAEWKVIGVVFIALATGTVMAARERADAASRGRRLTPARSGVGALARRHHGSGGERDEDDADHLPLGVGDHGERGERQQRRRPARPPPSGPSARDPTESAAGALA